MPLKLPSVTPVPPLRSYPQKTGWTVPQGFRTIYSHATGLPAGMRILFISGQFGVVAGGRFSAGFHEQVETAMNNVGALLASAGMTKENLVKLNYYLKRPAGDMRRETKKPRIGARLADGRC